MKLSARPIAARDPRAPALPFAAAVVGREHARYAPAELGGGRLRATPPTHLYSRTARLRPARLACLDTVDAYASLAVDGLSASSIDSAYGYVHYLKRAGTHRSRRGTGPRSTRTRRQRECTDEEVAGGWEPEEVGGGRVRRRRRGRRVSPPRADAFASRATQRPPVYPLRCVPRECSHHRQRGVAASFLHAVCWGGSGRSGAEREENAGRSRRRTGCGVGGCVRGGGEAGRAPRLRRGEEGGVGTRHAVSIRPRLVRDGSPRPRLASPPSAPAPAPSPPSTPVSPYAHARVLSTCAIVWPVVRSPRVRISAACICVRSWEARGRIRCVRWDAEEEEQREEEYAPVEERALRERERRDAQEMGRELQWGERGG